MKETYCQISHAHCASVPNIRKRPVVAVTRKVRYGSIDISTHQDGGWCFPEGCVEELRRTLKEFGIKRYYCGRKGMTVAKVPLQILDELASQLRCIFTFFKPA